MILTGCGKCLVHLRGNHGSAAEDDGKKMRCATGPPERRHSASLLCSVPCQINIMNHIKTQKNNKMVIVSEIA